MLNPSTLQDWLTLWCRNRQDSNEDANQELLGQGCIYTRINGRDSAAAVISGLHGGGWGERDGQGC